MDESDKQLALRTLREALQDPATRPADRLRAAEAILRADSAAPAATADTDALDDQALLLIARGGGTPPEMGPAGTSAGAVPSRAPAHPISLEPDAPRETQPANPFLRRGPKEDPSFRVPGGIPLAMGPKEDPPFRVPGGIPLAMGPKEDPDPWT